MTSTTRIPRAQLCDLYGTVIARMSRKLLGEVPESIEVCARCSVPARMHEGRITRMHSISNRLKLTGVREVAELRR
jgi:hypothetical protein